MPDTIKIRAEGSTFVMGFTLIVLTLAVCIPMTGATIRDKGGTLGFEMIGLAVLTPLCGYIFFGLAGVLKHPRRRRRLFIIGHVISTILGIIYCLVFPVYPIWIVVLPIAFFALSVFDRRNFFYYLLFMQSLGVAANTTLGMWEIMAGHSLPLFQVFGW